MKVISPLFGLALCVATLVLASCASPQTSLVLDPIGPQVGLPALAGATGSLRVFSAFDAAPDFNSLPYRRRYSSYTIFDKDGRVVQTVANRNVQRESPATVELPAGSYRVVARANGYGTVTVPIVIHPNRETVVHLEGSFSWPNPGALAQSNPVRLPHGEIAGWRAEVPEASKP